MPEQHPGWSPYAYVLDTPLRLVDPDGRQVDSGQGLWNLARAQANGNPNQASRLYRQYVQEQALANARGLLLIAAAYVAPGLARWVLTNPVAATEVGAAVGGVLLEGTEDLCPTCTGDELGRVVGNMLRSGTNAGTTVLGRFPYYRDFANELNANRFDIGDHWDEMIRSGMDPWSANKAFLDLAVKRGDDINLARPFSPDDVGSTLEREIQYLIDTYNYSLSKDGTRLLPPN